MCRRSASQPVHVRLKMETAILVDPGREVDDVNFRILPLGVAAQHVLGQRFDRTGTTGGPATICRSVVVELRRSIDVAVAAGYRNKDEQED
jgi:hypothetical protein